MPIRILLDAKTQAESYGWQSCECRQVRIRLCYNSWIAESLTVGTLPILGRVVMWVSWKQAKLERARQIGWVCEKCGCSISSRKAVGHHKKYRRNGGKNTVSNCELRCRKCEHDDPHGKGKKCFACGHRMTMVGEKYICQRCGYEWTLEGDFSGNTSIRFITGNPGDMDSPLL